MYATDGQELRQEINAFHLALTPRSRKTTYGRREKKLGLAINPRAASEAGGRRLRKWCGLRARHLPPAGPQPAGLRREPGAATPASRPRTCRVKRHLGDTGRPPRGRTGQGAGRGGAGARRHVRRKNSGLGRSRRRTVPLAKRSGRLSLSPSRYFRRAQRMRTPGPAPNPANSGAGSAVGKPGKGAWPRVEGAWLP